MHVAQNKNSISILLKNCSAIHIKSGLLLCTFFFNIFISFLKIKGGTVPHLTHEVLQMITNQKLGLYIPIAGIANLQDRVKKSNINIAKFIGMNEYLTYCSFINPGEKRREWVNEKNKVSVWSRFGRKVFTADTYMEFIKDIKPDMFVLLADGDTNSESSKKKIIKSFNNTCQLFERCLEIYKNSEVFQTCQALGAIEGGYDLKLREECSKLIGESPVFGVVIDGLHNYSESVSEMKFSDIKGVVEASLKHIPKDKLRIIHGCWNPCVILDLVQAGFDLFDSTYPYIITEQGGALIFPCDIYSKVNGMIDSFKNDLQCTTEELILQESQKKIEPPTKRIKLTTKSIYHISMLDSSHVSNFDPISKNCSCVTCKNHSRAYVNHLLNVEELLGFILLAIHNVHHFYKFLESIRKSLEAGTFKEFKKNFQKWAEAMDTNSS